MKFKFDLVLYISIYDARLGFKGDSFKFELGLPLNNPFSFFLVLRGNFAPGFKTLRLLIGMPGSLKVPLSGSEFKVYFI